MHVFPTQEFGRPPSTRSRGAGTPRGSPLCYTQLPFGAPVCRFTGYACGGSAGLQYALLSIQRNTAIIKRTRFPNSVLRCADGDVWFGGGLEALISFYMRPSGLVPCACGAAPESNTYFPLTSREIGRPRGGWPLAQHPPPASAAVYSTTFYTRTTAGSMCCPAEQVSQCRNDFTSPRPWRADGAGLSSDSCRSSFSRCSVIANAGLRGSLGCRCADCAGGSRVQMSALLTMTRYRLKCFP